jgi:uncharacterized phosphatase
VDEKRDFMILAMVRHGQTFFNENGLVQGRVDNPLNETGKEQARNLGKLLKEKGETFDMIASSPLSRSLETAYILSLELQMDQPIFVDHAFVERDFYHLDGTPVETAMPFVRQENYTFERYETDKMLVKRVSKGLDKFYQMHADKKVLFVAHSHVIKAVRKRIDPEKYSFADLIKNGDILYFEVTDEKIRVIE